MSYFLAPVLIAYPQARAVHIIRDGLDVVASLIEQGWLSGASKGVDEAGLGLGPQARFWVEPDRRDEFVRVSEATRAAWAWRRYVAAARASTERTLVIRYEDMVADPARTARTLAAHLSSDQAPLQVALSLAHTHSVGRWREALTADQVDDVEREAGPLLEELGYASP